MLKSIFKQILNLEISRFFVRKFYNSNLCSKNLQKRILEGIALSGVIACKMPNSQKLLLKTDANDKIASLFYWKGFDGFETDTLKLFMKLCKFSQNTIFDIGANTGIYSLIASLDNPEKQVYAFEPVPQIFTYFKENQKLNNLKNLQIFQTAITNHNGEITLYVPAEKSVLPTSASTLKGFRENCEAVSVEAITLDAFVQRHKIEKIDLLKIDTEATEHFVLEGGFQTLKKDKPIIICEVLKGRTEEFLHKILDQTDYKFFWIADEGLVPKEKIAGDPTYKNMNYLFVPESKIAELKKAKIL
ncbi:FkbM family methyltransferase [bacterium]|nr:FkbM family methyltransferase [bacterium]